MSLVTIKRSDSPTDNTDSSCLCHESTETDIENEDFFTSSATAVLQNQYGRRRSSVIDVGDTMQNGLRKAVSLLRKEDKLKLIINIEKVNTKMEGHRFFCVLLTTCKQDEGEYLILGVDISYNKPTIGLVLPICRDMSVALDGDSSFKVKNKDGEKLFKPTSVHALWLTVQLLNKACAIAHQRNYYIGGLNHTWIGYYMSKISSNRAQIAEWNRMIDANTITNSSMAPNSAIGEFVIGTEVDESFQNKDEIRRHLKDIMRDKDMDNITVTFLREKLQEKVTFNIKDYRSFISEEILIIYGQMDSASEILPYLYLGSTYNASNLEELQKNKITHILNVTRESENFFREKFIYHNVEVFDVDETNLLNYFNDCFQYISEAKYQKSVCLVHCQRGISRSASVVIAYMMKEFNWSRDRAIEHVKSKRDCILPNDSFMLQLKTYEGILKARMDFVALISNSKRVSQQFQAKKRNQIMSFPNELLHFNEKDDSLNSSTKTAAPFRQYASQIDRVPHFSSNNNQKIDDSSPSVGIDTGEVFSPKEPSFSYCVIDANEISDKTEAADLSKRLLRLKGDASWIRHQHDSVDTNVTLRDEVCRSQIIETQLGDNLEELSEHGRKCHSAQMDSVSLLTVQDKDVDQQSLRPVKELLTKYGTDDN